MIIDPEKVARIIEEIAQEEIAARFGKLAAGDIGTKSGPNDFVTEADHAAEARLKKALLGLMPDARFLGEELAAEHPKALDLLHEDGAVWVVDPLDGTRNFIEGRNRFGSVVALVRNGQTIAGWIYAIPDQAFAIASKGDGASWAGDMVGAQPAKENDLIGFRAIGNLEEPWRERLTPRLRDAYDTHPLSCSAYGYVDFLRGVRDFGLFARCWPWDHAAGVLMLEEIGGKAEYLDTGEAYRPVVTQGRPMLVAPNKDVWARLKTDLLS